MFPAFFFGEPCGLLQRYPALLPVEVDALTLTPPRHSLNDPSDIHAHASCLPLFDITSIEARDRQNEHRRKKIARVFPGIFHSHHVDNFVHEQRASGN